MALDAAGAAARDLGALPRPLLAGTRVVIVVEYLVVGGAERQAFQLAECLRRAFGAHVELWGLHHGGRLTEVCDAQGIPWRVAPLTAPVGTLRYWGQLARLALRLRRARPDVLLPYTTAPNVACGLVWRLAGAGACVWNQRDLGIDRLPGRLERRAVRSVSAFVANSPTGADYLVRALSAPAQRVNVVRNGVSPSTGGASRVEWRARIGAHDADLVACMVAHLHRAKDHETVLRAWRIVKQQWLGAGRRAVLALAGRPDNTHERLAALARELGVAEAVVFLGDVNDVPGLLSAVDLGVFSSRCPRLESSPNGLLECMAAGLPIVATDMTVVREVVPPEAVPFLFPPGDAVALGAHVVRLLEDDTLRRALGAACSRHIAEHFRPEAMCDAMADLIEQEISRP